ncbi:glycoside hydrolase family 5 protein [Pluteus cervinus]|uniref:Glycoside hydrolase family 5 protein n=1 Tax=Pluteus cervinus TaxID=181527 RepID=A0ACD3AUU9_9AGAR|nr:glycoside hydrolase family 5 protein [Pluteus cervinus]
MFNPLLSIALFCAVVSGARAASLPKQIYGVNLGSWLLIEPWMLPQEWVQMGGQNCDVCSNCIGSEFALAEAYPDTVDSIIGKHWESWLTLDDIHTLKAAGINTVRIPLGYWIVEDLVNRTTEHYVRGGLNQLRRGLKQLKDAGIVAILDHHALPGVAASEQQFAGRCTTDLQFYTPHNYHRALVWSAVMTALSHIDPAFANVASIHAMNEPLMDASKTPGYGDFQKNFVQVVRAVELSLGIVTPGLKLGATPSFANQNITVSLNVVAQQQDIFNQEVRSVLYDTIPILFRIALKSGLPFWVNPNQRTPLTTNFMDVNWQWGSPSNPADAAIGPQNYDNHLYYSYGGVADPNENAYLTHLCNLDRIQKDAAQGNSPLFFGEWSLSTGFSATDEFLNKWADAQKLQYSKGAGWLFWNFKLEVSDDPNGNARQWSYLEGLKRGYFTQDPSAYHDPHVCDAYYKNSTSP